MNILILELIIPLTSLSLQIIVITYSLIVLTSLNWLHKDLINFFFSPFPNLLLNLGLSWSPGCLKHGMVWNSWFSWHHFPSELQVCAITPKQYNPEGLDPTLLTSQVHHLGYTSSLPFLFFRVWIWWVHHPLWWVAFIPQFFRYKLPEPWTLHLPKFNHSNYRLF